MVQNIASVNRSCPASGSVYLRKWLLYNFCVEWMFINTNVTKNSTSDKIRGILLLHISFFLQHFQWKVFDYLVFLSLYAHEILDGAFWVATCYIKWVKGWLCTEAATKSIKLPCFLFQDWVDWIALVYIFRGIYNRSGVFISVKKKN